MIIWDDQATGSLLKLPVIKSMCDKEAKAVAETAKRLAPVKTGQYRESIHVDAVERKDRPAYFVAAEVPYALLVEARHGVLKRAMLANQKG